MIEGDLGKRVSGAADARSWQPAPLVRRFGALVLDWIACVLVSGTFANPVIQGWAPVLVLIVEYGFFLGLFAQTPGMRITKLRCVGFVDGNPVDGPVGVPRALLRGVLLSLVVPALIMDADKRGVQDRLAGSIVIVS
jgi:uncharacterized RDD family membrane protein YckC